jgi:hypothetical protein
MLNKHNKYTDCIQVNSNNYFQYYVLGDIQENMKRKEVGQQKQINPLPPKEN